MTQPWTTHSAPAAPRKPRRLGLYIPWGLAILLVVGWSGAWLWMKGEVERRLDAAATALRAAGGQLTWSSREVSGYPFRLHIDLTGVRVADASGWGFSAPEVKAEAPAYAPGDWIIAITNGLAFTRPHGGPVNVTARTLRASVNSWDEHPPRLSLVGEDMAFAAAPGAKPFLLTTAKKLEFYTRAGPQDQGATYLGVEAGQAAPGTWLTAITQGAPLALTASATFTHASAFRGGGWRPTVLGWAHGGGTLDVQQLTLTTGDAVFDARSGAVAVGDDGALVGSIIASLRDPGRFLTGGPAGAAPLQATLTYKDGAMWLGPVKLAPSPRVF